MTSTGDAPRPPEDSGSEEAQNGARTLLISRLAGTGIALVAAAALLELFVNGTTFWEADGPGPSFFPGVLAATLVVLGILLALDADGSTRKLERFKTDDEETARFSRTLQFCALLVVLILVFPILGGVLALGAFVAAEMLWVERRSVMQSLVVALASMAIIWLVFIYVLSVPLPRGIFAGLI